MNNRIQEIMDLEHFKTLTPIQEQVLNRKNKNRDIIGVSSTGSGKSHAFFMPIFEKLDFDQDCVQAVISAPTRELAYQLYDRCRKIAKHFNVRVKLVTGGMEKVTQMEKQPQIVIGTPGRMKDMFIKDNVLRLDTAKIVVIDEADMTLEFGFLEDIDEILSKMDKKVQMMVFSATIPESLQPFLKKYLYDPEFIEIKKEEAFQSDVKHILVPCKHKSYEQKILDVLPCIQPYVCLIFANTTQEAQNIANTMRENGYDLVELHSGLESRQRMQAIKMIQSQKKSYIVASDIASRGIDLEGITHVISCGFPKDLKFYIHRAGRTGRASRDGQGIEFEHQDVKNKQFVDLKPYVNKRPMKKDAFHEEVEKIVHKKKKVKPNYKKRQRQEIDRMKRKKRREMIKSDIKRQQKERAKERQRQKGMDI